ncbi:MAG: hypothetical protein RL226_2107 [Bacteroidota bacterium]
MRWLTLVIVALSLNGFSQTEYRFRNMTVNDGLSQNTVTDVFEDQHGFLWFGTQDGLNRFDGYNFKTYRNTRDSASLTDNYIFTIAEDRFGKIWVGTRSGLNRLDPATGKVTRFTELAENYFHSLVSTIISLPDGRLVAAEQGIWRIIDFDENEDPVFLPLPIQGIRAGAPTPNGAVFCDQQGSLTYFVEPSIFDHAGITDVHGMYCYNNCLAAWNDDTLAISEGTLKTIIPVEMRINDAIYQSNKLWLSTESGLFTYDGSLRRVSAQTGNASSIGEANSINDSYQKMFVDSRNRLWCGTNRHGVIFLPQMHSDFTYMPGNRFQDPVVWSMHSLDSLILVATTAGLEIIRNPVFPNSARNHNTDLRWNGFHATTILPVDSGWLIGAKDGILRLLSFNDGFTLKNSIALNGSPEVFSLAHGEDVIAAATSEGVYLIRSDVPPFKIYPKEVSKATPPYTLNVSIHQGKIYASHTAGLSIIDQNPPYASSLLAIPEGLTFQIVASTLVEDNQCWISTLGRGINRLNSDGAIDYWTAEDGLGNEVVYGGVKGLNETYWFSTNDGLSAIRNNRIIANLSVAQGVPFTEHSQNSFGTFDGYIWFGGIDGAYIFPDSLEPAPYTGRLLINEILINNKPILPGTNLKGSMFQPEHLTLHPSDNNLIIDFSIPDLESANLRPAYRLMGVDTSWVILNNGPQRLQLSSFPAELNAIEIASVDMKGQVVERLLQLPVVVYPPFWQTAWFFVLAVITVAIVVGLIIRADARRKLNIQRRKEETERTVREERERISMELHDNIGAQITHVITTLDNLSFKIKHKNETTVLPALEDLGDFSRGTMQQLRDTIWTLNKGDVSIGDFSERIQDYLSRLFNENHDIRQHVKLLGKTEVLIPASLTVNLFRIIQEAATNVIKHAQASTFDIMISGKEEAIELLIEDNGIGFSVQQLPEGHYGIRNMSARVRDVGGSITFDSNGSGTRISISVPIK